MGSLPSGWEPALDSLQPALYQGPSVCEEVKPVVTRLVVFGAAVGSLALLAGAVMLVLRLAQPTEYPVDRLRPPDGEIVGRVASVKAASTVKPAEMPSPAPLPRPEPPRVAQPKLPTPAPATPPRVAPAPQESESTDGSAAVDWFLKGRR